MLGLRCCMRAFCSCGKGGLLFVAVCGLLIVVASLVAAHGLSSCGSWALECRLSSCGARALLPGIWDLPGPGIEPVSPALAGGFLTTGPTEKPNTHTLKHNIFHILTITRSKHTYCGKLSKYGKEQREDKNHFKKFCCQYSLVCW